jgi:hypothetical protein
MDCYWPLAAHLNPEISTGFGSAFGPEAEQDFNPA